LADLITHIIIEDTNRKESKVAKAKALASRANLVQNKTRISIKNQGMIKSLRVKLITIIVILFLVLLTPPLRKKEIVMFVVSRAIMHLYADIA
jgi:glucan phosphoethanolaminetransferase (alkaline phosphatase superfamily)